MGGHGVGDCGLVSEDCVVALSISQTKRGGSAEEPPHFCWFNAIVVSETYAITHWVCLRLQGEENRSCS